MKIKQLWILVIAIEVVNFFLSGIIGQSQVNKCPRDTTLPLISVLFSISAVIALLILTIMSFKSRRWPMFITGLLGCIITVCAGFVLWFAAYGGINWCSFHLF